MQASLTFDTPTACGWCLSGVATTWLYATPTCIGCAGCTGRERVQKWLSAVHARQQGKQGA